MVKILRDRVVFQGKFLDVVERIFTTRSGKMGIWEVARRKVNGRVVSIFALTENGEVILEKNYRVHLQGYIIELPGGLMDRSGETEEETIRRELMEETGYEARDIQPIMVNPLNQRVFSDTIRVFFGSGARKIQKQKLDETEDIEVILVPLRDLIDFLEQVPPEIPIDQKVTACLPFLRKRGLILDYL